MKKYNLNNVDLQKQMMKDRINELFTAGCTHDPEKCPFGRCEFHNECHKIIYEREGFPNQRKPLKNLFKNLNSSIRSANGKRSPHNHGNTLMERIEYCLGQNIFEHELIKGCQWAEAAVSRCTTLNQVVEILDRRHVHLHGKSKIWHYNPNKWE